MGDEEAPAPAPAPAAPDYAAANREAIQADIQTLPQRRMVEQAARLGKKVTLPDGSVVDFSGMGEAELGREQARINAETAGMTAEAMLNLQKKYGSEFSAEALKRLEEADPTGMQARRELATNVLDDLRLGSELSPKAQQEAEQSIRRGQAARGNVLGNAAISEEVLGKYEMGEKLKQQRLSNVAAYVMGTPLTAQYQNIQGAQQGAAPYSPVAYQSGANINPNAGQQGTAFASSVYGTQAGIYGQQIGYQANTYDNSNPWMQGLGMLTGIGGSLGGAAIKACWVAEELYGKDDPKVDVIRQFCYRHRNDYGLLGRFCAAYQRDGIQWAERIQTDKPLRSMASVVWAVLLGLAERENAGSEPIQQIIERVIPVWMKEIEKKMEV